MVLPTIDHPLSDAERGVWDGQRGAYLNSQFMLEVFAEDVDPIFKKYFVGTNRFRTMVGATEVVLYQTLHRSKITMAVCSGMIGDSGKLMTTFVPRYFIFQALSPIARRGAVMEDATITHNVKAAVKALMTDLNNATTILTVAADRPELVAAIAAMTGIVAANCVIPIPEADITEVMMTGWTDGHIVTFLDAFALAMDTTTQQAAVTSAVAMTVIALCKRGDISPPKLRRIKDAIRKQTSFTMSFSKPDIESVYNSILRLGLAETAALPDDDPGSLHVFIRGFYSILPDQALVLRILLMQAHSSGLTRLSFCRTAMKQFPDFHWWTVTSHFPVDWTSFMAASEAVGRDEWYGFRSDLGAVAGSKYNNLAWICANLLIESGKDLITNYKGLKAPAHEGDWMTMIETYITTRDGAVDPGEVAPATWNPAEFNTMVDTWGTAFVEA